LKSQANINGPGLLEMVAREVIVLTVKVERLADSGSNSATESPVVPDKLLSKLVLSVLIVLPVKNSSMTSALA